MAAATAAREWHDHRGCPPEAFREDIGTEGAGPWRNASNAGLTPLAQVLIA